MAPEADLNGFVNVRSFGAKGDGETACTEAIQKAIDAAGAAGGGTVIVPSGAYVMGTLWMRSNVRLHLDAGARLLGSQRVEDFPEWLSEWEGPKAKKRRAAIISGEGLENVSITGQGTIDGRGQIWWDMQRASRGTEVLRPLTYRLVNSKKLLVEGITVTNSPMWTISPLACDNVSVRGVTISNPANSPNTDGINPESCRNVHIDGCHIDVGDDCITIKSGKEDDDRREYLPCENITVSNCTMLHGHGGVVVGSEMTGSVRNVVISNCVFVGTDRGLRFKSRRGRGGVVEDVRASNIMMDGVLCPISINLFYGSGAQGQAKVTDQSPWKVDETTPRFRRLRFSHITAKNIKAAAVYIRGLPEMAVEDVAIDSCSFYVDPDNETAASPDMAPGMPKVVGGGVIAQKVDRLSLREVDLAHVRGAAVSVREAKDLLVAGLRVSDRKGEGKVLDLQDVERAVLRDVPG